MRSTQPRDLAEELAALDARITAFLPPRYQHCYTAVAPNSMGSAGLKYGPDGKVAWGEVWTTFCDLALAGGPPHRGKLLEPVAEAVVAAQPELYAAVVAELERAIGLTTGRDVVAGYAPGWVGVRCGSVAEAAWLQFAVTAENVSARRRESVLQLPAGPAFQVEKEIKNVVVALAKSHHYWDGHLTTSQRDLAGPIVWEPAVRTETALHPAESEAAVVEVERALRAAGVATAPRRYPGWVGVQLANDEEAVWILRAVLVERVIARREGRVLYFPVGAHRNLAQAALVGQAFGQALDLWRASTRRGVAW